MARMSVGLEVGTSAVRVAAISRGRAGGTLEHLGEAVEQWMDGAGSV